ncbi:MAG: non-canonical purine NTP pyrophosphatase [Candidatus Latescibacterota bacterium]|nr:MAG: non-canonical purine NTP pyrophosphatase [Candidatus Latescibacterota bacterium]RKY72318.1 MAG: non-canonical purine NTP pyrophosphatase [Candidatus Latescibacterota bacterium]
MRLVLATRNEGKAKEIREALSGLEVDLLTLSDFPEVPEVHEDGATFSENAKKKALTVAKFTGLPALADDSGLEVDALGGMPGVRSARFAGEGADDDANNRKLLELLKGLPPERRTARFRCVLALAFPDGEVYTVEGTCEGLIAEEPAGEGGFGYDPLFLIPEEGRTFAQMTREEKNSLSHRGRALRKLREVLHQLIRRDTE